ncbi:MAG: hypothetical protein HZB46_12790 [Solirubrobacterales bacterium]|nr:hypothetical protein [Solirubrobacterales bacterium]
MAVVRTWLPIAILLAGVLLIVVRGGDETSIEGAFALWGAGLSVWLLNILFRIGVTGDRDRHAEDEARDYFERHGHWPDEAPTQGP